MDSFLVWLLHLTALVVGQQSPASSNDSSITNLCAANPCKNNGSCFVVSFADDVACLCPPRWTGKRCESANLCLLNPCENGASCELHEGDETSFKCHCPSGYVGKRCEKFCPSYLCENGGSCVLDDKNRKFRCVCAPGFVGDHCQNDVDECTSNPCLNGGVCQDKKLGYKCICPDGWMGERCQRPCRDIYKSCKLWRSEDRCTWARKVTRFFDINCGSSCNQCIHSNETISDDIPLPPVLEPFDFLIGTWETISLDALRYPTDFGEATKGYHETLQFLPAEVPMFGTPSVNVTSRCRSSINDDEKVAVGYLTLKPGSKPLRIYIMSTDNTGVSTIEEGTWQNGTLLMDTNYIESMPQVSGSLIRSAQRAFRLRGRQLQVTVLKYDRGGNFSYFNRLYTKIE